MTGKTDAPLTGGQRLKLFGTPAINAKLLDINAPWASQSHRYSKHLNRYGFAGVDAVNVYHSLTSVTVSYQNQVHRLGSALNRCVFQIDLAYSMH